MKILFVSSSSGSRGGGELHVIYLAGQLAHMGHDVCLWASDHSRMDELAEKFSAFGQVIRAPYKNTYDRRFRSVIGGARASSNVVDEWTRIAPDVIHVNKQNLEDGLDLLAAADATGIPSVCVIHITQSARYLEARYAGARDWRALRVLQRYSGSYVAVQRARARDLANFLGDDHDIRTINNGVPLYEDAEMQRLRARQREAMGIGQDEIVVTAVGRMVDQKRPQVFLEVARHVAARQPNVLFSWVGDGPLAPEWDEFVNRHTLSDVVRREPWQETVQPFLAAGDVFLHTAEFEGLPLALIEAMSARLPCVLPDDLARDMEVLPTDKMIVFSDPQEVADALEDPEALRKRGAAGRAFVEKSLSLGAMADQYIDLYHAAKAAAVV